MSDWHVEAIGLAFDVLVDKQALEDLKLPDGTDNLTAAHQAVIDLGNVVKQLESFIHSVQVERAMA